MHGTRILLKDLVVLLNFAGILYLLTFIFSASDKHFAGLSEAEKISVTSE
jgi:hypothetical protein